MKKGEELDGLIREKLAKLGYPLEMSK